MFIRQTAVQHKPKSYFSLRITNTSAICIEHMTQKAAAIISVILITKSDKFHVVHQAAVCCSV